MTVPTTNQPDNGASLLAEDMPTKNPSRTNLFIRFFLGVLALIAAWLVWQAWPTQEESSLVSNPGSAAYQTMSASQLEETYGLAVRLVAVTAGGGMVDFRLKVLDAQKARTLLMDPEMAPRLVVEKSGLVLTAPPLQEELRFEDGGVYFILFPNSGSALQPGDQVSVAFGENLRLEPVVAQ